MANKIQIRRDNQSSWSTIDPILSQGEIGYSIDENRIKVGDGTSSWNQLTYLASDTAAFTNQLLFTDSAVNFGDIYVTEGTIYSRQLKAGTESNFVGYENYGVVSTGNSDQYNSLIENLSTSPLATTQMVLRPDSGRTNAVEMVTGIVSSNFNDGNRPIYTPNTGFIVNSKGNLVIGAASANSRITFHVGGYGTADVTGYVDVDQWVLNKNVRILVGQSGPTSLRIKNTLNDVQSKAQVEIINAGNFNVLFGINSSNADGATGNIGVNEAYLYHSSNKTLHIGNTGEINFYADPADGFYGSPILQLTTSSNVAVNADLIPTGSRNLGSQSAQWSTVYLSSSTFSVADTVVEVLSDNITVGGVSIKDFSLVQTVPTSSTSTGAIGQIALTNAAMYVCVDTDSWLRFDGVTF